MPTSGGPYKVSRRGGSLGPGTPDESEGGAARGMLHLDGEGYQSAGAASYKKEQ